MQKTKLILFNKDDVKPLLKQLDFGFSDEEEGTVVIDQNGEIVKCTGCETTLTINSIGNIAHGSRKLFCDNPSCFATWVAKNKLK